MTPLTLALLLQAPAVDVQPLRGTAHLVQYRDSSGVINMLASGGPDGILLVDTPGDWQVMAIDSASARALRDALRPLGPRVRYVVNTHWHGDHTAGNPVFARATIVAHRNTRDRLAERQTPEWLPEGVGPLPVAGWPAVVFTDSMTLHVNGETVDLWNFGPAHTDGDAVVWFRGARVAHLGDLYHGFQYFSFGNDMAGMAVTLARVLERLPPDALIVTGHGEVEDREDLARYQRMLAETVEHVRRQAAAGATLEAVQAAGLPAAWASDGRSPEAVSAWLEEIYNGTRR